MNDRDIAPVVAQIFRDESTMAMLRSSLATQQHGGYVEHAARNSLLDAPLAHQRKKSLLVDFPVAFLLLVCVEDVLGGSEQWLVLVVRMTDDAQKVREIITLGEAREL